MLKKLFKLSIISTILSLSFLTVSCKHSNNNSSDSKKELLEGIVYYDTAYKTKFTSGYSYYTFSKGNKFEWKKNNNTASFDVKKVSKKSENIYDVTVSYDGSTQTITFEIFNNKNYIKLYAASGSLFNNQNDIVYIYEGNNGTEELLKDKVTYNKEYVYKDPDDNNIKDTIKFESNNVLTLKSTFYDGSEESGSFKIMKVNTTDGTTELSLVQTDSTESFYYKFSTIKIKISSDKNSFTSVSEENFGFTDDFPTNSTFKIE